MAPIFRRWQLARGSRNYRHLIELPKNGMCERFMGRLRRECLDDRLQDAGGWNSPAMPLRYVEKAKIANQGVRLE